MKPPRASLNTAHSGCKPSSSMSSSTHFLQVFLPLLLFFSSPPPHFYKRTPNHPHSYVSHAQTISIYPASPPQPRSEHPKGCTRPHFTSYPSETLHTSISPSYALLSPGSADSQPSLPMSQSHMSPVHILA